MKEATMKYLLKLWLFLGLLSFFGTAQAVDSSTCGVAHKVKKGETLSGILASKGIRPSQANISNVTAASNLQNPNVIRVDQELCIPRGIKVSTVKLAKVQSVGKKPWTWQHLNRAPLRDCGKRSMDDLLEESMQELKQRGFLTGQDVQDLREMMRKFQYDRVHIDQGDRYLAVAFCEKGKVTFREDVIVGWKAKPGEGEARRYTLPSGAVVNWAFDCANLLPVKRGKPPVPEPQIPVKPVEPPSEPMVPVEPPTPSLVPIPPDQPEPKVKVRGSDYDVALFAGGDTSPVGFAGGVGAYYPILTETKHGRLATGVGAFGSGWLGKTEDFSYNGVRGVIGLANKLSTPSGVDFGIKFPAWGKSWERGHNSSGYQMSRTASLFCGAFDVTDARRERAGEKWNPEYLLYLQLCRVSNIKAEHSYQGTPIADTTPLQNLSGIISVGGKLYWAKDFDTVFGGDSEWGKKLQPFVELGADRAIPTPWSWHAYPVGVRTVDKIWGVGIGAHVTEGHAVFGGAVTYDLGRDSKLSIERERWAEMVKSLEAQGVAVD
ncbi:MAG: LysM peptidoglycan-binding domain-containing protein [bacterium]|nr:LysM peptidoglycan-binding domain-containing protein [bacterium]